MRITLDAATLYMIVTLQDGTQSTSTFGFPSLRACAAGMDLFKEIERADRQGPIKGYWCVENKLPVTLSTCEWGWRGCEDFAMSSLRGCSALRWAMQMRNRSRSSHCYVGDGKETDEDKLPQPDPFDGGKP